MREISVVVLIFAFLFGFMLSERNYRHRKAQIDGAKLYVEIISELEKRKN